MGAHPVRVPPAMSEPDTPAPTAVGTTDDAASDLHPGDTADDLTANTPSGGEPDGAGPPVAEGDTRPGSGDADRLRTGGQARVHRGPPESAACRNTREGTNRTCPTPSSSSRRCPS